MTSARALLALAAALVVLTGCGSKDALELDPVANAAAKTADVGSARVAFETRTKAGELVVDVSGDGSFDFDESRGTLRIDVAGGPPESEFELRFVDSTMYLRAVRPLPGGKQWVSFDIGETFDAAGLGSVNPANLLQDPVQTLRLIRASSVDVHEAGRGDVRGVETTRYTAKLDLSKSIEATADELDLSEVERTQLRDTVDQLVEQAGSKTLPIEVYVDDDGLLRRLTMSMELEVDGEPFSLEQTVDYYEFGVDVRVDAPPASHVIVDQG